MLFHNLTVKGYVNEEFEAEPVVTLTITSMLTLEELEDMLSPIREAFNNLGQSLSFDVLFREIDV